MSDNGSENLAGSGRRASARVAPPNYAYLRQLDLQPVIADKSWQVVDESDFQQRAVVRQYQFSPSVQNIPRTCQSPSSDTMSLAMSAHSRSTAATPSAYSIYSPSPPSLGSYSSTESSPSARTSNSRVLVRSSLLPDLDRDAEVQGSLTCVYWFLDCPFSSDSLSEWESHCQHHLRGQLPKTVVCPFVCDWETSAATGREAWTERNAHISASHRGDATDHHRRPDTALLEHLWRSSVIDDAQLKELRQHGRLMQGYVYVRSAGSDRDRRRERRSRG